MAVALPPTLPSRPEMFAPEARIAPETPPLPSDAGAPTESPATVAVPTLATIEPRAPNDVSVPSESDPPEETNDPSVEPAPPSETIPPAQTSAQTQPTSQANERLHRPSEGVAAATGAAHAVTPEAAGYRPAPVLSDNEVLDRIRWEIKQRLPYFQACAENARRRTGYEVRRLQATWAIANDGTVRELKVEGVADRQLATCITRVGSRPLTVEPGQALTIPTPIVFVR
jgi:hypothetical protein